MNKDTVICLDYETATVSATGVTKASIEAWRPDFRVISAAATWVENGVMESIFLKDEAETRAFLCTLSSQPIVAHNIQYEIMCTKCRFPDIKLNWYADTMRLAQHFDNGGGDDDFIINFDEVSNNLVMEEQPSSGKWESTKGLGLVKCLKRILKYTGSHKEEAHSWLRNNKGIKKGKEGSNLDKLPEDILRRYNIADTENTYKLYEFMTGYFKAHRFDWTFDNQFFLNTVNLVVDAQIEGVLIDRDKLAVGIETLRKEIKSIETDFRSKYAKSILIVEGLRLKTWLDKCKTEKGKLKRLAKYEALDIKAQKEVKFNVGSNAQLLALFGGQMGIQPKFFTAKNNPSFKSSVLSQWGPGGEMLGKRRKRTMVLQQCTSLHELSESDGKWHLGLKVAGTSTGRAAGGSH